MEQYIEIKAANPDCLLFYRMGDFYELFFEDAEVAARALGIVLTKRGKHLGRDIPMCGVPVHRADEYLHRLIALGHRVAVCEQLEDPAEARKRGGKSVVRRDVIRLVTPGTLTEDTLLDARRNNYLLAIARARARPARTAASRSPGSTSRPANSASPNATAPALAAEIARLEPGEIIVSDALYGDAELAPYLRSLPAVTPLTRDVFDGATAERRLAGYFAVATTRGVRRALAARAHRRRRLHHLCRAHAARQAPAALAAAARGRKARRSLIDQATRSNLELVRTLAGERRGSLLAAIDRTVTAAGSRLLAQRLAAPLTDPAAIARRHDAVALFVADAGAARRRARSVCKAAPDLARALARLVVGRGGPRDLAAIRDGIAAAAEPRRRAASSCRSIAAELAQAAQSLRRPDPAIAAELAAALADELPHLKRDGGFVRAGYDAALDEARALRDDRAA